MTRRDASDGLPLDLLLTEYRSAHARYRQRAEDLHWWISGTIVSAIATPVIFAVDHLPGGRPWSSVGGLVFPVGSVFTFAVCRIAWLALAKRRSRRQIRRLKSDVDCIGYHVACDRSLPLERKLLLEPYRPRGRHIVLFESPEIDFAEYDRTFRI